MDSTSTMDMEAAVTLMPQAKAEADHIDRDGVAQAFSQRRTFGEFLFDAPPPPTPDAVISPTLTPTFSIPMASGAHGSSSSMGPEQAMSHSDLYSPVGGSFSPPVTTARHSSRVPDFSGPVQRIPDSVNWSIALEYLDFLGVGSARSNNNGSTRSSWKNVNNCMDRSRQLFEKQTRPWGITAHPHSQDIFVTDRETHEILHYTYPAGIPVLTSRFGKHGEAPASFRRPTGIAVDATNSRLVIADKDNHRISIYSLAGNFISTFGKAGHQDGEFNYPWGVAVSPDGNYIAVADSRNYRVQLFDGTGKYLCKYSAYDYEMEFYYPRGICFDNKGSTIFVSDFNLHTIFALNLDLTESTTLAPVGLLNRPQGLVVDSHKRVFVCDSRSNSIRVLSPYGRLITTITNSGDYKFDQPIDICTCYGGFLCVLDAAGQLRLF